MLTLLLFLVLGQAHAGPSTYGILTYPVFLESSECPIVDTAGSASGSLKYCFTTTNYPSDYPSQDDCTFTSKIAGTGLTKIAFVTEASSSCLYDYLTFDGTRYCSGSGGNDDLSGVSLSIDETFTWKSDGSGQESGIHACLPAPSAVTCVASTDSSQTTPDPTTGDFYCVDGTISGTTTTGCLCTPLDCIYDFNPTETYHKDCVSGTVEGTAGNCRCDCPLDVLGLKQMFGGRCATDTDECTNINVERASHNCSTHGTCVNNVGGFTCTCSNGFSGFSCDECTIESLGCVVGAALDDGSACTCSCPIIVQDGEMFFRSLATGAQCENDVNECTNTNPSQATHNCDVNAACTNLVGDTGVPGFSCACNAGWEGDGTTCSDVDECTAETDDCEDYHECLNIDGDHLCLCKMFFLSSGSDSNGNPVCICPAGSELQNPAPGSQICTACESGKTNPNTDSTCQNSECPTDYVLKTTGFDASLAYNSINNCDACAAGYFSNDPVATSCSDIDECTLGTDNCDANADCANTDGSFTCTCNVGYSGDGVTCVASSCVLSSNPVTDNEVNCFNGGAATGNTGACGCDCPKDTNSKLLFYGGSCQNDVNECTNTNVGRAVHNCDADATCSNTVGNFTCTTQVCGENEQVVSSGFDIALDGSSSNANCEPCSVGFTSSAGPSPTCTDLDECVQTSTSFPQLCDVNGTASCTHGINTRNCVCNAGYEGDRCQTNINDCSPNPCQNGGVCTDLVNDYLCTCPSTPGCGDPFVLVNSFATGCELPYSRIESQAECTLAAQAFGYGSALTHSWGNLVEDCGVYTPGLQPY